MPVTVATSNLQTIQQKVRRLTRNPSENELSTTDLNQYINTAVLYDFPAHLRLFALRQTLTFYTQPNVDTYSTTTTNVNDPLYDFENIYVTVHPQVYVSGLATFFTQNRDVFYGNFPQVTSVINTGLVGNGGIGPFSGTLSSLTPLQNSVIFTAIDVTGKAMQIIDYPQTPVTGLLARPTAPGNPIINPGTINYITGAYNFNFQNATATTLANGNVNTIWAEAQFYQPGLPTAVLYFNNSFTLRPVPDKSYPVQLQVDIRPTELLSSTQDPNINQWWQYIAYLAAKKIFEDRFDLDSVAAIMPELEKQQNLVNRTNLVQFVNDRSVTIYTQAKNYGWGWYNNGNWPF